MPSDFSAAAVAHYDHPSEIEKIERLLELLPPAANRFLDAGCGDGRLAAALVRRGKLVVGLDANAAAVAAARERGLAAELADLEDVWPVADAEFDCVILADVLEHLTRPEIALGEAWRALAAGGRAIVVFPNHFDLRERLEILLGRGIVHWSHQKYPNADAASYAHLRFLRRFELAKLVEGCGFEIAAWQFNFMSGGLLPSRIIPAAVRKFFARKWPDLFSGKFGLMLRKDKTGEVPKIIAIERTTLGM